jgi:hypothetical protein
MIVGNKLKELWCNNAVKNFQCGGEPNRLRAVAKFYRIFHRTSGIFMLAGRSAGEAVLSTSDTQISKSGAWDLTLYFRGLARLEGQGHGAIELSIADRTVTE